MTKSIADVFRCAKDYLWDGDDCLTPRKERYICHCIDNAIATNRVDWYTGRKAIQIINNRLDKSCTLEAWLTENGVNIYIQGGTYLHNKIQATRLAWLDSLIEEFSK